MLPLALAREWLIALLAGEQWRGGADAMALLALGLAFYGAYYVVGVAVGRVKRTQLNWVVTGIAAVTNVVLCIVLIPHYGAKGAGAASAIAYFLMAVLMVAARQSRVPRRLRLARAWRRSARSPPASSRSATRRFAARGASGVAGRLVVAALFVPLALSADLAVRRAAPRR